MDLVNALFSLSDQVQHLGTLTPDVLFTLAVGLTLFVAYGARKLTRPAHKPKL